MSSGHDHHAGLPAEPGRPWPGPGPLPPAGVNGSRVLAPGSSGTLRPVGAPSTAADPIALLKAFRRRWPLAIGLGLVAAAAVSAGAWLIIPPAEYTTNATLRVNMFRPKVIFGTKEDQTEFRTYQQTQAALIRNPLVLEKALTNEAVANLPLVKQQDDPVAWLSEELKVSFSPLAEVINLSFSGENPRAIKAILDAVIEAYEKNVINVEAEERLRRLEYLQKISTQYVDQLKSKREQLRQKAEKSGANDKETLALRTDFAYENMAKAKQLRLALLSEIMQAQAEVDVLEAKLASAPPPPSSAPARDVDPDLALNQVEANDPEIRAAQARIQEMDRQIEATRGLARKGSDAALMRWRREMERAQRDLQERRTYLRSQAAARGEDPTLAPANPAEESLMIANERLQKLKLYDQKLTDQIKEYEEEAKKHNANAMDLHTDETQVATLDATTQEVQKEIQALQVELTAPNRVSIVSRPNLPIVKDDLKQLKILGVLGLGVFGITVLGITMLEYRARRIGSLDEVVQGLGMPLVGALPALPTKSQKALARRDGEAEKWRSRLIESIDATRTMLLHVSRTESIRVVMITSALKGEGKTSLASHLATSLARAGRKTLLIDCDLRRPSLHRLFDVPMDPGVCELLRGDATDPTALIHPTPAGELDVMTAGRCDALALQMLAQDGARGIFTAVASDYDFVLVDTSPVLPVADALLLGQQVDAVLFSIMHEVSCVPHVQQAYDRLAMLGVRVLGAVVNGAAGSNYGYDGYAVYEQAGARG